MADSIKLTKQQQRVLTLVYKFRFVNAPLLANMMGIRRESVYEVLEYLVKQKLVAKVYKREWRIDRKPAYYYLSKSGVTTVRKLLGLKESAVNTLYHDNRASQEFITHCQTILGCYTSIKQHLPVNSSIFTKTEINRFKQFPKNRPDLYIQTSNDKEIMVIVADDLPKYILSKRLDEILEHSEEEGWAGASYPVIAFVFRDERDKNSFLYTANKKLDGMGMGEDEIVILATNAESLKAGWYKIWFNAFTPQTPTTLPRS